MLINITQKHIDAGEECNCYSCPIALAISEIFPNKEIGIVCYDSFLPQKYTLEITEQYNKKQYILPSIANDFINSFDSSIDVEPFSFELEIS
jgi:hypothetical protein